MISPVIQLIHDRREGKKDHAVLSLVIGGGAMRGSIAGGMLTVLEEAGAHEVFDHVYGASAGATNGAMLLAHQCRELLPIFLRELTTRRFIRVTRRGLFLDIRFIYETLLAHDAPLDTARVSAHRTLLHIPVTDAETGETRWYTNRDGLNLLTVLMASAAVPVFYNRPVLLGGRRYLDGGVTEPLPVARAIREGATHLLVLPTVPVSYRAVNRHPLMERWMRRRVNKFGRGFREAFDERYHVFNRSLDLAFGRAFLPEGVSLYTVAPRTLIGWAERRRGVLAQAVEEGREAMRSALR